MNTIFSLFFSYKLKTKEFLQANKKINDHFKK